MPKVLTKNKHDNLNDGNLIMDIPAQTQKLYFTVLQNLHIKHFGKAYTDFERLTAHGSDRFIARLKTESGSCIGIVNANIEENTAFIEFGKTFKDAGLNVPEIYCAASDKGSYLLEDLGDETLLQRVTGTGSFNEEIVSLYKQAIDELIRFQTVGADKINFGLCYQYNEFGNDNIEYDLNYFTERFLKVFYSGEIDNEKLSSELGFIKDKILELPKDYFLYRDFQSRNIMIKDEKLYFIDFQSGRKGAQLYDAASLLYDAKADVPQSIREELLDYYILKAGSKAKLKVNLKQYFWYFALVRILQAMGAYGYVGIVKGREKFLESIPYALKNINFILSQRIPEGELNYLKLIFSELNKTGIKNIKAVTGK